MRYDTDKLVRRRLEKGWTQKDVVTAILKKYGPDEAVSQPLVHYAEKGGQNPNTIKKIAAVLGLNLADLIIDNQHGSAARGGKLAGSRK